MIIFFKIIILFTIYFRAICVTGLIFIQFNFLDGVNRSKSPSHKRTALEQWNNTLRRTGVGITTETMGSKDSFSGLRKSQMKNMSYGSTSHYLRQIVGTEKSKKLPPESPGRFFVNSKTFFVQCTVAAHLFSCHIKLIFCCLHFRPAF